ncbi:YaiI/YqxD family protein [Chthonobacter rhizosphaerae]|uniref:YaiI/YqxD family protein n=1 Tax=Chthonobacter rhizosphaerae TaxID=2735553 RepID=UPI0015EF67E7|nr:YaiI/YqxD family protein [Chthonobacter rhizosphaerae]
MAGTVYVDADACPVKQEIYKVAGRHRWPVVLVANAWMAVPRDEDVRLHVVPEGPDEADKWIAAAAGAGDVVVTADIPLADRCVKAGATVIAPSGKPFSPDSIGMALAVRDLMTDLRSAGETTGGPRPFSPKDRSRFLSALHEAIVRIGRG